MLNRLGEAGLKLKAKKCQLFQEEIPFLRHIVSAGGIGPDPAKCQQVRGQNRQGGEELHPGKARMTRSMGGMAISPKGRHRTRLEDAAQTLTRRTAPTPVWETEGRIHRDDKAGAG